MYIASSNAPTLSTFFRTLFDHTGLRISSARHPPSSSPRSRPRPRGMTAVARRPVRPYARVFRDDAGSEERSRSSDDGMPKPLGMAAVTRRWGEDVRSPHDRAGMSTCMLTHHTRTHTYIHIYVHICSHVYEYMLRTCAGMNNTNDTDASGLS